MREASHYIKTLQRKSTPQTTKSIRVDIDAEQLGQLKNAGIEVQVLVNESVNEVCEKLVTMRSFVGIVGKENFKEVVTQAPPRGEVKLSGDKKNRRADIKRILSKGPLNGRAIAELLKADDHNLVHATLSDMASRGVITSTKDKPRVYALSTADLQELRETLPKKISHMG